MSEVMKELLSLRPSDVITKTKLATESHLDVKSAEQILIELVNEGILEMIFAVNCKNEEEQHVVLYDNVESLYQSQNKHCQYCDSSMDFKNVRVGFKRKQ